MIRVTRIDLGKTIKCTFESQPLTMEPITPCPFLPHPDALMDFFKRDIEQQVMKGVFDEE